MSGHGKLTRFGTYVRSSGNVARQNKMSDAKRFAEREPEKGKPFTGDNKDIWYNEKTGKFSNDPKKGYIKGRI